MLKFVCSSCGAEYHADHVKKWGMTAESQSYGPRPVCSALLADTAGGYGVCRGALFPVSATSAEVSKLVAPKPIAL